MAKLIALSPINHDGKEFAEGDELSVKDDDQTAALVAVGAAVVKGAKSPAQVAAEEAAAAREAADAADAKARDEAAKGDQPPAA
jgi:hypothetical protein